MDFGYWWSFNPPTLNDIRKLWMGDRGSGFGARGGRFEARGGGLGSVQS